MFKKKLSVAVNAAMMAGAVALSSGVYAAQPTTAEVGDLALLPIMTAQGSYVSGVHITNTSGSTQVVKFRYREGEDSDDAIDFIIVLSPYDVWTGALTKDSDGKPVIYTDDKSCTVPEAVDNFIYPKDPAGNNTAIAGDLSGYGEVIAMGQTTTEDYSINPIAFHALHTDGVPNNCEAVRENFEAPRYDTALDSLTGVIDHNTTYSSATELEFGIPTTVNYGSQFEDADNVLRVSWFVRDSASGFEFGNTAVHIKDFADDAMMANQEFGLNDRDTLPALPVAWTDAGVDFPDLDGGAAANGGTIGLFNSLRDTNVLGVTEISNDWTYNSDLNTQNQWVTTFPGQYLLDTNKDIPVTVVKSIWDREEGKAPDRGLVVSPVDSYDYTITLPRESNLLSWFTEEDLLTDPDTQTIMDNDEFDDFDPKYGWASFDMISSNTSPSYTDVQNLGSGFISDIFVRLGGQGYFVPDLDSDSQLLPAATDPAIDNYGIPTIGGNVTKRSFGISARNYGRYQAHTTNSEDGDS